jgi:hypothetical protein
MLFIEQVQIWPIFINDIISNLPLTQFLFVEGKIKKYFGFKLINIQTYQHVS